MSRSATAPGQASRATTRGARGAKTSAAANAVSAYSGAVGCTKTDRPSAAPATTHRRRLAVGRSLQRNHRRPHEPGEEHRVRPAERRVEHGDRRGRRQEHDRRGRIVVVEQTAHDQRDRGQRKAEEDERGHPERRQARPPAEQEVLEPEMQRTAAALRRDDVEDVAERVVAEPERQLLVDVQR